MKLRLRLLVATSATHETSMASAPEDGNSGANNKAIPPPARATKSATTGGDDLAQRKAGMAVARKRIQSLYDAGTPLFTSDALQSVARQLDEDPGIRSGKLNTVVTLVGMDGKEVQVETRSGRVSSASTGHPEMVWVLLWPEIEYWSIEKLTGSGRWHVRSYDPAQAYLPIRISYHAEVRHRNADGTLSAKGRNTVAELATGLAEAHLASVTETGPPASPVSAPRPEPTVEQVREIFEQSRSTWEASEACRQLRETLVTALAPQGQSLHERVPVRKVVAFACSTMTCRRKRDARRHATQHALILTVRDVLEQLQRMQLEDDKDTARAKEAHDLTPTLTWGHVNCFVQDPVYHASDRAVLTEVGITVLDDPHGFLAVDETSMVIAIAPAVPVRQIVSDLTRPAAMIWARVVDTQVPQRTEDMGGWTDPASARVKKMVRREYREFDLPNDIENFGTMDGTVICVRRIGPVADGPTEAQRRGSSKYSFRRLKRSVFC